MCGSLLAFQERILIIINAYRLIRLYAIEPKLFMKGERWVWGAESVINVQQIKSPESRETKPSLVALEQRRPLLAEYALNYVCLYRDSILLIAFL